ncbi:MAG: ADOP family duplicated permease [Vicinamibacterales bacterium]
MPVGVRLLVRQPWSTAAIVGILALGIGATTAAFAMFNAVLFRPLPGVERPADLVTVRLQPRDRSRNFSSFSRDHFVAMRDADTGLDGLTSEWRGNGWVANGAGAPELIDLAGVARGYFAVLGIRMRLGRPPDDDEVETPGHAVAVISEALWRHQFSAAPDVIGGTMSLNGEPFTIVGVAQAYRGWSLVFRTDLWLPMAEWPVVDRRTKIDRLWEGGFFDVFGRRRPGIGIDAVEPRLGAVFAAVDAQAGTSRAAPLMPIVTAGLSQISQGSIESRLRAIYRVLATGTLVLLLLACANAATLVLAQSTRRQAELALRRALGGGRWAVMRLQLVETGSQTLLAWGLGLGVAMLIAALFHGTRLLPYMPSVDIELDWRVVAFAGAAAAITILAFGLMPAWLAASVDPRRLLTNDRSLTRPTHRLRSTLVALQFALSLALVVSAAVLFRSLLTLRHQDLGFDPRQVVEFDVNPAEHGDTPARTDALYRDVLAHLAGMAGVEHAGFSSPAPISTSSMGAGVRRAGMPDAPVVRATAATVSPEYFATMRIPLLDGRVFRDAEFLRPGETTPTAVILSQALARRLFGDEPPVGREVALGTAANAPTAEIIGVVGDVKWADLRADPRLMMYKPSQPDLVFGTFVIRSSRSADEILRLARGVVRDLAPGLPLYDTGTMDADLDLQLVEERVIARLMGVVAVLAGIIALAGLYAVVAQLVAERTRELGIRIALGAPGRSIAAVVLRPVAALTLTGAVIGVGLVLASTKLLAARVYRVSPTDPWTIALATAALAGATLLAAWRPVRRATRIDPTEALRTE